MLLFNPAASFPGKPKSFPAHSEAPFTSLELIKRPSPRSASRVFPGEGRGFWLRQMAISADRNVCKRIWEFQESSAMRFLAQRIRTQGAGFFANFRVTTTGFFPRRTFASWACQAPTTSEQLGSDMGRGTLTWASWFAFGFLLEPQKSKKIRLSVSSRKNVG